MQTREPRGIDGPCGVPLLDAVPNPMVARRTAFMDDGSDHVCFIVEPTHVHREDVRIAMRLSDVLHLQPGHAAHERATEA